MSKKKGKAKAEPKPKPKPKSRGRAPREADAFTWFLALGGQTGAQKFEAAEHIWLGAAGMKRALEVAARVGLAFESDFSYIRRLNTDDELTYGELVALSGDFYRSPEDLFEEKPALLPWLYEKNDLKDIRGKFAEELAFVEKQRRGEAVGYPDNNVAFAWNAKSYIELALENNNHFGWHNMVAYCEHHKKALEVAACAYAENNAGAKDRLRREALFRNAFADHFLTDAFAAGHIRVPREQIRVWAKAVGYDEKLAGALSKLLHDQDGHIPTSPHGGEGEGNRAATDGLRVRNSLAPATDWYTRCDGQLFIAKKQGDGDMVEQPVEAVKASVLELMDALSTGVTPAPGARYAAADHVPFPHPDEPSLCEKFSPETARIAELLATTRWYTKIPLVGAALKSEHINALFHALPSLMRMFRARVAKDLDGNAELQARLPEAYRQAFLRIE